MKTRYTEEAVDGVDYTFGYENVDLNAHPYFFIDTSEGEQLTLELKPSQLRHMAMKMIKMSYRVEAQ